MPPRSSVRPCEPSSSVGWLPLWAPPSPTPPAAVLFGAVGGGGGDVPLFMLGEQVPPSCPGGHFRRVLFGHDAVAREGLTAAAERLVERHERERGLAAARD